MAPVSTGAPSPLMARLPPSPCGKEGGITPSKPSEIAPVAAVLISTGTDTSHHREPWDVGTGETR